MVLSGSRSDESSVSWSLVRDSSKLLKLPKKVSAPWISDLIWTFKEWDLEAAAGDTKSLCLWRNHLPCYCPGLLLNLLEMDRQQHQMQDHFKQLSLENGRYCTVIDVQNGRSGRSTSCIISLTPFLNHNIGKKGPELSMPGFPGTTFWDHSTENFNFIAIS